LLPKKFGNETLLGNGTLPENEGNIGNETLLSNGTLPYWSDSSPYGEPVPENLFLLVLDAGMVGFQSSLHGDTESVSMLFYWLLTRQRRSILYLTYAQMVEKFKYTKPKLSRALDKFREHPLFSVNASHKGVFIDIRKLIELVKTTYPQSDLNNGNETLPLVSSSSFRSCYKRTTTTTGTQNEVQSFQTLLDLSSSEFHTLVDIITFYGFGPKEISQKVTEAISYTYKNHSLEKIAFNLAYAAWNKKVRSPIAYLLKTFHEDYGSSSLSLEAREKAQKVIEVFKTARSGNLDDHSTNDLLRFLFILGKPMPEGCTRQQYLDTINGILSSAAELHQKMSQIIGRSEKKGRR
jgi:hypothetical protein